MSDRKNRVTSGLIVRMCFCFHNTEPLFINLLLYLNKSICTLREAIHTKIVWLYAVNPTLGKKKTEESNWGAFHTHLYCKRKNREKSKAKESFLCASVCLRVHVYKHLPVGVCMLLPSCHTLQGRGIEGSPPESCVYVGFFCLIFPPCMTSVTSRNSSAFYIYFQFCCNDLQKRTAITFSHPKVLQELRERGEWLKHLITVGEGREAGTGRLEWGKSFTCLYLGKVLNRILSANIWKRYSCLFYAFGEKWYPRVTISTDNKNNWKISWNFWVFNYV